EPWQAQQPARSNGADECRQRRVPSAERSKRFEHGKIGLARAILVEAFSVSAMSLADFGHKALDERRLSDAGFTSDPDELSFAGRGLLPRRAKALHPTSSRCQS